MYPTVAGLSDPVEIGRGGFGTVYRAREDRFQRAIALKVIRGHGMSEELIARFTRECQALGSLSGHPNIVAVHDTGQTGDGELYLTMEHLPGGSLAQRVARTGRVSADDAIHWGVALAGALETAHRAGIIHRDVKPENVLFSGVGAPKLVDFGIARMRSGFETRSGSISATLNHAGPEVIAGAPVTARADIYSLASLLFFALAGHAPFERPGESSLAPLIARISATPPPDLREHGVPAGLAAVIEQGLAKEPADRFASANAFGLALQKAARDAGLPVPVLPVSADAADPVDAVDPVAVTVVTGVEADASTDRTLATLSPSGSAPVAGAAVLAEVALSPAQPSRLRRRAIAAAIAVATTAVLIAGGVLLAHVADGPSAQAAGTKAAAPGDSSSSARDNGQRENGQVDAGAVTSTAGGGLIGGPGGLGGPASPTVAPTSIGPSTTIRVTQTSAKQANRAPILTLRNQSSDEGTAVGVSVGAADPDGDAVTVSVSGLPAGLSSSGAQISGTVSYAASSVTTTWRSLASQNFTVAVMATDSHGLATTSSFVWTVRDTETLMPNYNGYFGCNGDTNCNEPVPNVDLLSAHNGQCTVNPNGGGQIVAQSVPAGTVIMRSQTVVYTYAEKSC